MIKEEPIDAPIEVKLDPKPTAPKKPNFGSKPSFGLKKPFFGIGAKKPSIQIAAKIEPIPEVKKESPKPVSVRKSIEDSIEMDLDENIPTIEDSQDSPVKAINKQEFPQAQPKQEENPY
jgi:hypothetical protein